MPTDTIWGISCDATNSNAIMKIYSLKKRSLNKPFITLVSNLFLLENIVGEIPDKIIKLIENEKKPTTLIYKSGKNISNKVFSSDGSVAIRLVKDIFCKKLIEKFGKPIVSTSANINNEIAPKSFAQINQKIINGVDYIVNLKRESNLKNPSRIISVTDNKIFQIRG
tara:strand:+ start:65775 stop:66275 length:501 start_codon:yes stop_codon:yes gene_type:complete